MNFNKIYKNKIDIIKTNRPNWILELFKKLNIYRKIENKDINFEEGTIVLLNILDTVKKLGCKTIIIEKNYLDIDYLEEYSAFYYRSYESYPPKTERLHFFEKSISYNKLKCLSSKGYLGYSVVRPIDSYRSGRTVLPPFYEDSKKSFIPCKAKYYAHLLGSNLEVIGTPFIQQDSNVNVCAQASIWMASYYLHQKYGYPRYYPPNITLFATRNMAVGSSRYGLTPIQVITALRDMGYQLATFDIISSEVPKNNYIYINTLLIYSYVRSGLPVILILEVPKEIPEKEVPKEIPEKEVPEENPHHAICLIGYKYDFDSKFFPQDLFCENSIECFYYQDDAVGPYQKLYKRHPKEISKEEVKNTFSIEKNAKIAIVPMPKEISLQAEDVYLRIPSLLDLNFLNYYTVELLGKKLKNKVAAFLKEEIDDLICHFYLKNSSNFKSTLPEEMNDHLKLLYKAMSLPKYIWVVELTKKNLIRESLEKNKPHKIIGEIIIDSTADRNDTGPKSFLAIHLYGRLIIRRPKKPNDDLIMPYFYPDEEPYPRSL